MKPELMARELAPVIKEFVAQQLSTRDEKISALEKKLSDSMHFRGVFQKSERYGRNDVTICDGGLWYCLRSIDGADGKPGTDAAASGWQMMTKTR